MSQQFRTSSSSSSRTSQKPSRSNDVNDNNDYNLEEDDYTINDNDHHYHDDYVVGRNYSLEVIDDDGNDMFVMDSNNVDHIYMGKTNPYDSDEGSYSSFAKKYDNDDMFATITTTTTTTTAVTNDATKQPMEQQQQHDVGEFDELINSLNELEDDIRLAATSNNNNTNNDDNHRRPSRMSYLAADETDKNETTIATTTLRNSFARGTQPVKNYYQQLASSTKKNSTTNNTNLDYFLNDDDRNNDVVETPFQSSLLLRRKTNNPNSYNNTSTTTTTTIQEDEDQPEQEQQQPTDERGLLDPQTSSGGGGGTATDEMTTISTAAGSVVSGTSRSSRRGGGRRHHPITNNPLRASSSSSSSSKLRPWDNDDGGDDATNTTTPNDEPIRRTNRYRTNSTKLTTTEMTNEQQLSEEFDNVPSIVNEEREQQQYQQSREGYDVSIGASIDQETTIVEPPYQGTQQNVRTETREDYLKINPNSSSRTHSSSSAAVASAAVTATTTATTAGKMVSSASTSPDQKFSVVATKSRQLESMTTTPVTIAASTNEISRDRTTSVKDRLKQFEQQVNTKNNNIRPTANWKRQPAKQVPQQSNMAKVTSAQQFHETSKHRLSQKLLSKYSDHSKSHHSRNNPSSPQRPGTNKNDSEIQRKKLDHDVTTFMPQSATKAATAGNDFKYYDNQNSEDDDGEASDDNDSMKNCNNNEDSSVSGDSLDNSSIGKTSRKDTATQQRTSHGSNDVARDNNSKPIRESPFLLDDDDDDDDDVNEAFKVVDEFLNSTSFASTYNLRDRNISSEEKKYDEDNDNRNEDGIPIGIRDEYGSDVSYGNIANIVHDSEDEDRIGSSPNDNDSKSTIRIEVDGSTDNGDGNSSFYGDDDDDDDCNIDAIAALDDYLMTVQSIRNIGSTGSGNSTNPVDTTAAEDSRQTSDVARATSPRNEILKENQLIEKEGEQLLEKQKAMDVGTRLEDTDRATTITTVETAVAIIGDAISATESPENDTEEQSHLAALSTDSSVPGMRNETSIPQSPSRLSEYKRKLLSRSQVPSNEVIRVNNSLTPATSNQQQTTQPESEPDNMKAKALMTAAPLVLSEKSFSFDEALETNKAKEIDSKEDSHDIHGTSASTKVDNPDDEKAEQTTKSDPAPLNQPNRTKPRVIVPDSDSDDDLYNDDDDENQVANYESDENSASSESCKNNNHRSGGRDKSIDQNEVKHKSISNTVVRGPLDISDDDDDPDGPLQSIHFSSKMLLSSTSDDQNEGNDATMKNLNDSIGNSIGLDLNFDSMFHDDEYGYDDDTTDDDSDEDDIADAKGLDNLSLADASFMIFRDEATDDGQQPVPGGSAQTTGTHDTVSLTNSDFDTTEAVTEAKTSQSLDPEEIEKRRQKAIALANVLKSWGQSAKPEPEVAMIRKKVNATEKGSVKKSRSGRRRSSSSKDGQSPRKQGKSVAFSPLLGDIQEGKSSGEKKKKSRSLRKKKLPEGMTLVKVKRQRPPATLPKLVGGLALMENNETMKTLSKLEYSRRVWVEDQLKANQKEWESYKRSLQDFVTETEKVNSLVRSSFESLSDYSVALDCICRDVFVNKDGELLDDMQRDELVASGYVSDSLRTSTVLNPIIQAFNRLRDELDCYVPLMESSSVQTLMLHSEIADKVALFETRGNELVEFSEAISAEDEVQKKFGSLMMATGTFGVKDDSNNSSEFGEPESSDRWLCEASYRNSARTARLLWIQNRRKLQVLYKEIIHFDDEQRTRLKDILQTFITRRQKCLGAAGELLRPVTSTLRQDIASRKENYDIEAEVIEQTIEKISKTRMKDDKNLAKNSDLAPSDPSYSFSRGERHLALLGSDLSESAFVEERKILEVMVGTEWQLALGVLTKDYYLHIFVTNFVTDESIFEYERISMKALSQVIKSPNPDYSVRLTYCEIKSCFDLVELSAEGADSGVIDPRKLTLVPQVVDEGTGRFGIFRKKKRQQQHQSENDSAELTIRLRSENEAWLLVNSVKCIVANSENETMTVGNKK